jgi:hypothetical protein
MVNPHRVTKENIPVIFRGKNWMVLETPQLCPHENYNDFYMSSIHIGQNIFVINPHLCLVDEFQTNLINVLKHYGIESLTVPCDVSRPFAGGMHCMTNDFCREEDMDFSKILNSDVNTPEELAGYFDPYLLAFLKQEGDVSDWVEIANKHGIFPTYLTDHISSKNMKSAVREKI